ncbi:unnamed protein product [Protopolystoma xenopodis]|uniref:Uncharacterized protein n=1 Tax=Protopolystoma xenopodis TaxID=117903 RepID=A0A448X108_9PLAT|nr:unnamed protein product [Protopolystoma xenopodis]
MHLQAVLISDSDLRPSSLDQNGDSGGDLDGLVYLDIHGDWETEAGSPREEKIVDENDDGDGRAMRGANSDDEMDAKVRCGSQGSSDSSGNDQHLVEAYPGQLDSLTRSNYKLGSAGMQLPLLQSFHSQPTSSTDPHLAVRQVGYDLSKAPHHHIGHTHHRNYELQHHHPQKQSHLTGHHVSDQSQRLSEEIVNSEEENLSEKVEEEAEKEERCRRLESEESSQEEEEEDQEEGACEDDVVEEKEEENQKLHSTRARGHCVMTSRAGMGRPQTLEARHLVQTNSCQEYQPRSSLPITPKAGFTHSVLQQHLPSHKLQQPQHNPRQNLRQLQRRQPRQILQAESGHPKETHRNTRATSVASTTSATNLTITTSWRPSTAPQRGSAAAATVSVAAPSSALATGKKHHPVARTRISLVDQQKQRIGQTLPGQNCFLSRNQSVLLGSKLTPSR